MAVKFWRNIDLDTGRRPIERFHTEVAWREKRLLQKQTEFIRRHEARAQRPEIVELGRMTRDYLIAFGLPPHDKPVGHDDVVFADHLADIPDYRVRSESV